MVHVTAFLYKLWSTGWNVIRTKSGIILTEIIGRKTHPNRPKNHVIIDDSRYMKKGNVLFNDSLNTFDLRLCGVTHMVKDH